MFLKRYSSKKPKGFAIDEAFSDAWRVAGVKVRVLKTHVKNRVFFYLFESLALIYVYVSMNVISVSDISAVNFIVG